MKLLALDTASAQCSVALLDRTSSCRARAVATAREHAQLLLPMIDAAARRGGSAAAAARRHRVRSRPGFVHGRARRGRGHAGTGARRRRCRCLPVSDLRALALQALRRAAEPAADAARRAHRAACMDARMGEVYWAAFAVRTRRGWPTSADRAGRCAPAGCAVAVPDLRIGCRGPRLWRWPQIAASLQLPSQRTCSTMRSPCTRRLRRLAAGRPGRGRARGWMPRDAQPVYLRDQVADRKSSRLLLRCKMAVTIPVMKLLREATPAADRISCGRF